MGELEEARELGWTGDEASAAVEVAAAARALAAAAAAAEASEQLGAAAAAEGGDSTAAVGAEEEDDDEQGEEEQELEEDWGPSRVLARSRASAIAAHGRAIVTTGACMDTSGSDASALAERARPREPACIGQAVISSQIVGVGIVIACTCTSVSAISRAKRGETAKDIPRCVTAAAIAAQSPWQSVANSTCDGREARRLHSTDASLLMVRTVARETLVASTRCHSVMYRLRCVIGGFARSARNFKPSS